MVELFTLHSLHKLILHQSYLQIKIHSIYFGLTSHDFFTDEHHTLSSRPSLTLHQLLLIGQNTGASFTSHLNSFTPSLFINRHILPYLPSLILWPFLAAGYNNEQLL